MYYAFSTNSGETNIQVIRSPDLVPWEVLGDALPKLPAWAVQDFSWAWAPDVSKVGGRNVIYFTVRFAIQKGGTQCIGVATSDRPQGPYAPYGDKPLICQVSEGGSIDPASFVEEDGSRYLLWKHDGNSGRGQTFILFYSANDYASPRYAVGLATSDALLGHTRSPAAPTRSRPSHGSPLASKKGSSGRAARPWCWAPRAIPGSCSTAGWPAATGDSTWRAWSGTAAGPRSSIPKGLCPRPECGIEASQLE